MIYFFIMLNAVNICRQQLSESISVVDPTPASQPVTSDTAVTNSSCEF